MVKPDQLIKRRGKLGLIKVKTSLDEVKQWIADKMGKDEEVSKIGLFKKLFKQEQGRMRRRLE